MWRLGYCATRASLRRVLDGARAADRWQDAAEAGEAPKPVRELRFEVRASRNPGRPRLIQIGRRVVPAYAARDPAHDVEDRLPVGDDE